MVCGGRLGNSIINYCLLLIKNGIWVELPPHVTMKKARMNAAAINFEGVWWVTGNDDFEVLIPAEAFIRAEYCITKLGLSCAKLSTA